ncbi:MAG: T9SS type A sorting domain-containing protein [Lentimicrobium sp.]
MKTTKFYTKKATVILCISILATIATQSYAKSFDEYCCLKNETSGSTLIVRNSGIINTSPTTLNKYPEPDQKMGLSDLMETADCISAPIAYEVWGSGEYCGAVGFEFGIYNSEIDVTYFLYQKFGDERFLVWGAEQTGTGGPVTFFQEAGEYLILGKNACDSTWMTGSANVMPFNTKTYISSQINNICAGSPVTFNAKPERSGNEDYSFIWSVNNNNGYYGGDEFTYTPVNGDVVTAIMYSPCFDFESNNAIVMMVRDCPGNYTTWTGTSNNDWYNPLNWNNGVPGPGYFANIPGGMENYPTLSSPASCESLIIEDGGSFIGSEFLNLKSALVTRNISSPAFHFLSSPMGYPYPSLGGVFPANQQTTWARLYNEYSGDWNNLTVSRLFDQRDAFSIQSTQPQTAQFIGLLNRSNVTSYLYYNNPGSDPDRAGWNLIGNPFSSAIYWNQVILNSAEQSVYVWNGSQYISWNGTIGALSNGIIPPQSGFFVKALGPGYIQNRSVTIPLSARVHSNVPFFKESVADMLELEVDGNNHKDQVFIRFNNDATRGFDIASDARKLYGVKEAPQLFSFTDGLEFTINELPFFYKEIIDIGFTCGNSGDFLLIAKGLESFNNKVRIVLEDQKEGIFQDISDNRQYRFSYISGESEHRFKLHFTEISSIPESAEVNIYSVGKTLIVNNFTGLNGEIQVFDFTGRMILNSIIDSGNQSSFTLSEAAGPYVVKVLTAKGVHSRKVVIM